MFEIRNRVDQDIPFIAQLWWNSWEATGLSSHHDPAPSGYVERLKTEARNGP
ncbi:hypothetical protein [Acetobacter senegalensis]|nr:hypothetical protein [Acetobacter senegalensis]